MKLLRAAAYYTDAAVGVGLFLFALICVFTLAIWGAETKASPAAPAPAASADAPPPNKEPVACCHDLDGVYLVEGTEKGPYAGATVITRVGDVYRVQTVVGGKPTIGIGVRQGDLFAVGWTMGQVQGVTTYKINGRNLAGRWASVPGSGRMHDERLTFLRALPAHD
jgi:hypothetical protein